MERKLMTFKPLLMLAALIATFVLVLSPTSDAQSYLNAISGSQFAAPAPVEKGFVNLANGNLHIEIPISAAPQRGRRGFAASLVYDSRIWKVVTGSSSTWQPTNVPNSMGGWRLVTSADPGVVNYTQIGTSCTYNPPPPAQQQQVGDGYQDTNFTWTDPSGVAHPFAISTSQTYSTVCSSASSSPNAIGYATDSSGLKISITNYSAAVVYGRDGSQLYPTVTDSNGNYFSNDTNGNVVDTLKRTQVTKTTNGNLIYYDVLNSQGSTSRFTVTTTTINVNTSFGQSGVTEYSGSFAAIQSITLPDQTSYSFTYDSGTTSGNFGLLKTMTVPATGQTTYGFTTFQDSTGHRNRWLSGRTSQTGTWSGTWSYTPAVITTCTVGQSTCKQKVTVTQPTNDYAVHTFSLDSGWGGAWDTQQQTYSSGNTLMVTGTTTYDMTHGSNYIVPTVQQVTIPVPGSTSISRQTKFTYDNSLYTNGNVTAVKEWAWNQGTSPSYPTTPDRETDISYVANYGNIISLPSAVTLLGAGSQLSKTIYSYDNASQLTAMSGATHHDDTNFGIGNTVRGNPTQVQSWVTGTTYLNTNIYYDTTGQVTKVVDPANNATAYQYGDGNFYSDNGANPPAAYTPSVTTNAYVTQVNLPVIGSRTYGYYYNSGKRTFARDGNGADSYAHFVDPLDRRSHSYGPQISQLGNNRAWAMRTYTGQQQVDVYRTRTDTTPSTGCSNCLHSQLQTDGFKRKTKSQLLTDPEGAVNRDFAYDNMGRWQSVSNPYRSTGDSTYGTQQQPAYDALNRIVGVTLADNNVHHTYYGSNVATNGGLSTQLCPTTPYGLGYPVLSVDPAGKMRQIWKDGFGRLIEVDEPDPNTGSLNLSTCYLRDARGVVKSIVQGSQTRSFVYDGLGRLTSRTLPESGTTRFSYTTSGGQLCAGHAGKVCSVTDARNVTTTYAYDALNRITSKSYSDSTPSVTYSYDQSSYNGLSITNGTGRLTGMQESSGSTVNGTTAWTYDAAGRVLTEKKTVGTITKSISYTYNLDGSLNSVTYPSGHTVTYTYGNAGKALSAIDSVSNINYAIGATYAPHGKMSGAIYGQVAGGFTGITRTKSYNNRLQMTAFRDSSSNGTIKDLAYSYNQGSGVNNGRVVQMTDNAVPGRTQNYAYDYMNRLKTATTQATSGSDCWGQSFTRDRYNNLTNVGSIQCSAPMLNQAVSTTTNQISTYSYDLAGHVTYDGINHYTWDAEHRLTSGGGVNYTYDGMGRRVQKSTGEISWYDTKGHLLATSDSSGNLINEYIYFGGRRIARREANGAVYYYFNDNANTNRAMTDSSGVVQQMSEYYPTGGEKLIVGAVSNVMKFAGNQLDSETGLYATQNMYQPATGSGLAPLASGQSGNPQSLNQYVQMGNQMNAAGASAAAAGEQSSIASTMDAFNGMNQTMMGGAGWAAFSAETGFGDDGLYDIPQGGNYSGNVAGPSGGSDTSSASNTSGSTDTSGSSDTPVGVVPGSSSQDASTVADAIDVTGNAAGSVMPQQGDPGPVDYSGALGQAGQMLGQFSDLISGVFLAETAGVGGAVSLGLDGVAAIGAATATAASTVGDFAESVYYNPEVMSNVYDFLSAMSDPNVAAPIAATFGGFAAFVTPNPLADWHSTSGDVSEAIDQAIEKGAQTQLPPTIVSFPGGGYIYVGP